MQAAAHHLFNLAGENLGVVGFEEDEKFAVKLADKVFGSFLIGDSLRVHMKHLRQFTTFLFFFFTHLRDILCPKKPRQVNYLGTELFCRFKTEIDKDNPIGYLILIHKKLC